MKKIVVILLVFSIVGMMSLFVNFGIKEKKVNVDKLNEANAYYSTYENYYTCIGSGEAYVKSYYSRCADSYIAKAQVYYTYSGKIHSIYIAFPNYSLFGQPYQGNYRVSFQDYYSYQTDIVDIYMGDPNLNNQNKEYMTVMVNKSEYEPYVDDGVGGLFEMYLNDFLKMMEDEIIGYSF